MSSLLTEYAPQGLRLIEIERDDLSDLPKIQKLIQNHVSLLTAHHSLVGHLKIAKYFE
jgi:predicted AAA+ superfamily ATPase